MKYETEDEIERLVTAFESATITRDEWRHSDHLVVALYYLTRHDIATATDKMRSGILKLLRHAFKVDLANEMPYHETITLFWMKEIANFNALTNGDSLVTKIEEMVRRFDKDYLLKFYSRERLFSDEARAGFVEPDLQSENVEV